MKRTLKTFGVIALAVGLVFTLDSCKKSGCIDETALNYDSEAEEDDGSCEYEEVVEGSTDSTATNYNANANVDDGTCTYPVATNPCAGEAEFCMDFGGTSKSGEATVTDYGNGQWRIYWTTGTDYEQLELDVFGSDVGTYDISDSKAAGTSSFEYYHATDGVEEGASGSVVIDTWDPTGDGITGTFFVTTANGVEVTDGNVWEAK